MFPYCLLFYNFFEGFSRWIIFLIAAIIVKRRFFMKKLLDNKLFIYLMLTIGSLVCAFGLNCFLLPYKLTMGGYSGFASVFYYVSGLPVGLGMILLNIPTFIFAYKYLGRTFFLRSIYALSIFTAGTWIFPKVFLAGDILIASIYGGLLMGIGLGVNLYFGGSTGGTDLLAVMVNKKLPVLSVSAVLFVVDAVAVALTALAASLEAALYSLIAVVIVIKCVDIVTEGVKRARVFIIISRKHEEVKNEIYNRLERGVTELSAVGGFSGIKNRALLCTVEKGREAAELKKIIERIDDGAFVIRMDAREVIGNGFGRSG